jgi:hypothetical protein
MISPLVALCHRPRALEHVERVFRRALEGRT